MASFRAKIFRFRAIYIVIFTFHAGIFGYIYGIPFGDLLAIGTIGLMLVLILPRVGALWGAAVTGLAFSGYIVLCYTLFVRSGWILNMVYPLSVLLVSYVGLTGYTYLTEARQKRFIRSAFSTYLAPSVVKQLIESPDRLVLGGERRVITAFFSDVEGFTPVSESLPPSELVELLNEFLTEMTDIVFDHAGTVDKFEGDTVNTAARLEGINKIYGVYTLIGETTYRELNQGFVVRKIDSVRVAGKQQPVGIYELIGCFSKSPGRRSGRWTESGASGPVSIL